MKNKVLKLKLSVLGILSSALLQAQARNSGLSSVANTLQTEGQSITPIIQTITNWVLGVFGLVALVRLILIFTSQGSGEDKISKAGTWIFMLIFVVVGYALSKILF